MGFKVRDLEGQPGKFVHGSFEVDGIKIPIVIGEGAKDGPALLLVCAQHQTEFSGPAVAQKVIADFELSKLRGTIVILPFTCILQVMWQRDIDTYKDRFDEEAVKSIQGTNMNRVWPGKVDGNLVERAAYFIYEEICRQVDAIVDFHCCRVADARFAACSEGHGPSLELAKAFGWRVIDQASSESYKKGLLYIFGGPDLDIPAILAETYSHGIVTQDMVDACYQGILNTLVHIGMMEGKLVLPPRQTVFRRADPVEIIKAEIPGFLATYREPGDIVKAGELLCAVRGLDTFEVAQEVRAPRDGGLPSIGPGGPMNLVLPGEEICTLKQVRGIVENG